MKFYAPKADGQPTLHEHTRPFYVPGNLSDLHGPEHGLITLPVSLDATPANTFDLSLPTRVRSMYAKVLLGASDESLIADYVNRLLLSREWQALRLPAYVRHAWEATYPELVSRGEGSRC